MFFYLGLYHIRETEYFAGEEDVVIPKHVLEEHAVEAAKLDEEKRSSITVPKERVKAGEKGSIE